MPLKFDATLKDLAMQGPHGFLSFLGVAVADPVTLLSVDLSTVTTSTDIVFGLGGSPPQRVVHVDCQTSADADLHFNLIARHALLFRHYRVPVHTTVLLLRPQARHPTLTGNVRYEAQPGRGRMDFAYEVVELWEKPVEELLAADVGILPLAPLGRVPAGVSVEEGLGPVIQRLVERLLKEVPPEQGKRLLTSAFVLTGMRLSQAAALSLFRGVKAMHESSTYQYILDQGAATEARKILLRLGRKAFGEPDEATKAAIAGIQDIDRLERLCDGVIIAGNWHDLLQTP